MRNVTLTADDELIKVARESGINLSLIFREALTKKLKVKKMVNIDDVIAELVDQMSEADKARQILEARKQEIIDDKEREKKEIIDKFKDIPEVQNLSLDQLNDTILLSKLVDMIRGKYERRVGIVDIRKYYEVVSNG